jgi:hypothetical protein
MLTPHTNDSDLTALLALGVPPKSAFLTAKYLFWHRPFWRLRAKDRAKARIWAWTAVINAWDRRILDTEDAKAQLRDLGFEVEAEQLDRLTPSRGTTWIDRLVSRVVYG